MNNELDIYKLNKPELLKETERLLEVEKKHEALLLKYGTLQTARKEDKEVVDKAQSILNNFQQREDELKNAFEQQMMESNKNIEEQNDTILSLFSMMDNAMNQQVFYYKKYKDVFINTPPQEELKKTKKE